MKLIKRTTTTITESFSEQGEATPEIDDVEPDDVDADDVEPDDVEPEDEEDEPKTKSPARRKRR